MKKIISTNEAPGAIGPYSQAVRSGSFLFCSGQIPLTPGGDLVQGDIRTQTKHKLRLYCRKSPFKHGELDELLWRREADTAAENGPYQPILTQSLRPGRRGQVAGPSSA